MTKASSWLWVLALTVAVWPAMPAGASQRCYPKTRFVAAEGAVVRDTLTKLVWQQYTSPTTMLWADAPGYCSSSGFRLPTVKELSSIVDFSVASPGPAINLTAFPNTLSEAYWTSTPYEGSSGAWAWVVWFSSGESGHADVGVGRRVRCVR